MEPWDNDMPSEKQLENWREANEYTHEGEDADDPGELPEEDQEARDDQLWIKVSDDISVKLDEDLQTAKMYINGRTVYQCSAETLQQLGSGVRDRIYQLTALDQANSAQLIQAALFQSGCFNLLGVYRTERGHFVVRLQGRNSQQEYIAANWSDYQQAQQQEQRYLFNHPTR